MSAVAPDSASVEVPASCANLGPGFDTLAAAVDLHLVVSTTARGSARVSCTGQGAGELPTDATNLVWTCFAAYCERFGVETPDVSLHAANAIPLERGLGSSAAAAVAGVALARAVTRGGGDNQDLIDLAADFEGHPDNAAAAVLGGIVACSEGRARRFEPAPGLWPIVCMPKQRQSTEAARGILPDSVSLADAAGNGGRAALVLAGLTGGCAYDPAEMVDVLHEPPRFGVMPESGRLVTELRAAGLGACLSGAGPAVLVIAEGDQQAIASRVRDVGGPAWEVRPSGWDRAGAVAYAPVA